MTYLISRSAMAAGLLLLTTAIVPACAQDPASADPANVRLDSATGTVSIRHGDDGPWIAAASGQRLDAGDHILTGRKSEVDIRLDEANIFHAGRDAEVRLDQAGANLYRLTVIQGALTCHVAGTSAADVEVGTPSVAVRTVTPGVYLIGVTHGGESEITALAGSVEVLAPRGSEWVNTGQKMIARGPASDPVYKIGRAISVWRRVAFLVSNMIQIAASINPGGGAADDTQASSQSSDSSKAPAKSTSTSTPAGPSSAGRAPSASPAPPSTSRGK